MGDLLVAANAEIARLRAWVADLQSGMVLNCVYCGQQYGPLSSPTPREQLDAHVRTCPEHPLAALRRAVRRYLQAEVRYAAAATASRACDARAGRAALAGDPSDGAFALAAEVDDLKWFARAERDAAHVALLALGLAEEDARG